jgi:hypothetical protein
VTFIKGKEFSKMFIVIDSIISKSAPNVIIKNYPIL